MERLIVKAFVKLGLGSPPEWAVLLIIGLIAGIILLVVILTYEGIATYIERKVAGDIQVRYGPNRVGPYGILQFVADGLKLFFKEDIIHSQADRLLFRVAPYIVFTGSFVGLAAIPFSAEWYAGRLNVGVLFILATTSLVVAGLAMAGWAQANKWGLLGGMRSVAQIVSYEVAVGIALLVPVVHIGSLDLQSAVLYQKKGWGILGWNIFHDPFTLIAFFIYFTAAIAECNRTPFDLPEGESELVAGYFTEYTGFRFAFFFMAEYGDMFVVSALATCLFLGGWHIPFIEGLIKLPILHNILGSIVFIAKVMVLILIMMWVRWTYPRLRIDQLMALNWKRLIPIGLLMLLLASLWDLIFDGKGFFELIGIIK
jgi:NADH-quinone oxidoreductase subunit H